MICYNHKFLSSLWTTQSDETDRLVNEGSQIKTGGAPGAFDKEFRDMEMRLEEVRNITSGANFTSKDLDELKSKLSQIRSVSEAIRKISAGDGAFLVRFMY